MTRKMDVLETPPEEELAIVLHNGENDRVAELLEFGVDPNLRSEHESYAAVACRVGNHIGLLRLLKAGAKITRPVLSDAILGGNPRCADRVLDELYYEGLELDVDVEASQILLRRGTTPKLNVPMLQWLAKQGVDLAVRSAHGSSLYELAERDRASDEVIAFLRDFDDRA